MEILPIERPEENKYMTYPLFSTLKPLSQQTDRSDYREGTKPVMLQRRRRLGVLSPLYPLDTPSPEGGGTGMVMVIGLWNFLLLGSTVTIGLNVALFPRIFFTISSGTG